MKVIVLYENTAEETLAKNLVAVIKKIGAMLVYGKVSDAGVLLEDWQNKPKTKIECVAGPAPSMPAAEPGVRGMEQFSYEMQYRDGYGYLGIAQPTPGKLGITRELARDLVKMFPDSTEAKRAKTKPVVPKPDTTKTGVTVRDLDMWEDEDDHADQAD